MISLFSETVIWSPCHYTIFFQTFLQASGKVSKKKSMNKPRPKVKKISGAGATSSTIKNNESVNSNAETASRPGTASSVGRKVDELFQVSKTYYLLLALLCVDDPVTNGQLPSMLVGVGLYPTCLHFLKK